jgi:virulence factor
MGQKMSVAILGLGNIAQKAYLPILSADESIELLFYNRSEDRLKSTQARYRVENGTTSLACVIESKPKAAFVLTSSHSHFEIVKQLIENDIDVFIEKPATLHSWETNELAALADRKGRILMVGFNRRFAPLHVQAKHAWGDTPISMGIFRKCRANAGYPHLRSQFVEDTIHQIDALRFFCGEGHPVGVTHQVASGCILSAVCSVQLENGGIGIIETAMDAGRWQENYAVIGGGQSLEIDAFWEVTLARGSEQQRWNETYASTWQTTLAGRGFVSEIEHFFECVKTRHTPLTDAWDSVKTQTLLEEMIDLSEKDRSD